MELGFDANGQVCLKGGPGSGPHPGNGDRTPMKNPDDSRNGRYGRGNLDSEKSWGGTANGRATRVGDKTRFGQSGPMTHEVVKPLSGSKEHFDLKPLVGGVPAYKDFRANYLHTMHREA